jgi:hypothetical protein
MGSCCGVAARAARSSLADLIAVGVRSCAQRLAIRSMTTAAQPPPADQFLDACVGRSALSSLPATADIVPRMQLSARDIMQRILLAGAVLSRISEQGGRLTAQGNVLTTAIPRTKVTQSEPPLACLLGKRAYPLSVGSSTRAAFRESFTKAQDRYREIVL